MERLYYSLRIRTEESNYDLVSDILNVRPLDLSNGWVFEIDRVDDQYYDFINEFLNLLEGKYNELSKIGIQREDISIWLVYEYNGQCNFEFAPEHMKRLGENEVTLCLSCYEGGE